MNACGYDLESCCGIFSVWTLREQVATAALDIGDDHTAEVRNHFLCCI